MNEYYNSQREKTDKRGKSFEIQNKFVCSKTLGGFTIFFGKRKRKKKFFGKCFQNFQPSVFQPSLIDQRLLSNELISGGISSAVTSNSVIHE